MEPRLLEPPKIVSALAGFGERDDCEAHDGLCWVCAAQMTRGQPVKRWNGASFTGQNRVRCPDSSHVCEACVWICSRIAPVPGRPPKPDKKFGGNFRNYSHLYEKGWRSPVFGDDSSRASGYINASKGEKPSIRAFLAREHAGPWFAAIADSGQKHVIPWVPANGPGRAGVALFDEALLMIPSDQSLIADMAELLTMGATKEETGTGEYTARAWQLCGQTLKNFEASHSGERHGSWFRLALWLAQRDEEQVQRRMTAEKEAKKNGKAKGRRRGKAAEPDGGSNARAESRLPRDAAGERAEALGHVDDTPAQLSPDVRDTGGVGYVDVAQAPDSGPGQAVLPGFE